MVVVVFSSTIVDAVTTLLLIVLFSPSSGIYHSILTNMFPQALVNALVASLIFIICSFGSKGERL